MCKKCYKFAEFTRGKLCFKCGKIQCICHARELHFDYAAAPFIYSGDIRISILKLKEYKHFSLSQGFVYYMLPLIMEFPDFDVIDMITPVPLYKSRKNQRGYNQSEILAYNLSKNLNIKMQKDVIKKIKDTGIQHELKAQERKYNLLNAFSVNKKLSKGKNILLVDDVMTTGETFNECAKELKKAGANKIYCIAVATTV